MIHQEVVHTYVEAAIFSIGISNEKWVQNMAE